mmetsp:Transcript_9601/g.23629  ORF Transcript_9601/g.23629 Transcript_9601/m.23629 type:complete len:213 (-) Transcript_9601:205-843(-)
MPTKHTTHLLQKQAEEETRKREEERRKKEQLNLKKIQEQIRRQQEETKKKQAVEMRRQDDEQRSFFIKEAERVRGDRLKSVEIFPNLNALASLNKEQLYKFFIVPQIIRMALERPSIRAHLLQQGGKDWAKRRTQKFVNRDRKRTNDCPLPEREIRLLETKVIIKLAYPADQMTGTSALIQRESLLAAAVVPPLKTLIRPGVFDKINFDSTR